MDFSIEYLTAPVPPKPNGPAFSLAFLEDTVVDGISQGNQGEEMLPLDPQTKDEEMSLLDPSSECDDMQHEEYEDSSSESEADWSESEHENCGESEQGSFDESEGASSDEQEEATSIRRTVGRPRAAVGSQADNKRNQRRRERAQERKAEDVLEANYRAAVAAQEDARAEELMLQLVQTKRGRELFPTFATSSSELKHYQKLGENVKELNSSMGKRSKHRQALSTKVTAGLPPSFTRDVLDLNPATLRKNRERQNKATDPPALLADSRTEGAGRESWSEAMVDAIRDFFLSRTHILSGANTETRQLLMTKKRLEAELYAEYPSLLRAAAEQDPSMAPKKRTGILTLQQANTLAAQYSADQEGWSRGQEYKMRLDSILQRFLALCFAHCSN